MVAEPSEMDGYVGGPHALPEYANFAEGHVPGKSGKPELVPLTSHRFLAPAGGGPMARVGDMSAFAAVMLSDGVSRSGNRVLSRRWTRLMKTRWVTGPAATFASAWGLGTMLHDWTNGVSLYGHDGVVLGQSFFFRLHDPSQSAIIIMLNGGLADGFAEDVFRRVFAPILGGAPAPLPQPIDMDPIHLDRFTGVYAAPSARISVSARGKALIAAYTFLGSAAGDPTTMEVDLAPVSDDLFLASFPNRRSPLLQRFQDFDDRQRPHVLNFRGRAFHREAGIGQAQ